MSDKRDKDFDQWTDLSAQSLEKYQTKEFEEASYISPGGDDFKAFEVSSKEDDFKAFEVASEDESFTPFIQGQNFDEPEDNSADVNSQKDEDALKTKEDLPQDEKKADPFGKKEKKNPKIDALALVVEQEKEQARKEGYDKGFSEGFQKAEEDIKAKFEQENNALREESKKQGYEDGRTEGYEKGKQEAFDELKKEFEEKTEGLLELIESIESVWPDMLRKYEEQIAELSLNMAKKVLFSNLTLDSNFVKIAIKEALRELPDPYEVTIGVNPDDYNIIEMIKEDFFSRFENLKNVTIISDPAIGRGGCTIDSETGGITQTVENRLRELEDALLKNGLMNNQNI